MKALLIAEKPSAMRDMHSAYKKMKFKDDVTFTCARGHLLTMKDPGEYKDEWKTWKLDSLPMIPEKFQYKVVEKIMKKGGKFTTIVDDDANKRLNEIIKELNSGKYDYVINAADPEREGELIFKLIYHYAGCNLPVKRYWPKDLTDKSLIEAFNDLKDDKEFKNLEAAARFRQAFDWLTGMNLSRALSIKANIKGASIGRVVTPTLAIVVRRELELRDFKPTPYWEIEGDFGIYKGLWFDPEEKETKFFNKDKAIQKVNNLGTEGIIEELSKKNNTKKPPSLHSLGELQKEANLVFKYSLDKTLELAQSLYEKHKLLTYPRTDSVHLTTNLSKEIRDHLMAISEIEEVKNYVGNILKDNKRIEKTLKDKNYVNDKEVKDHHAIIPTHLKPNLSRLSKDEKNIYLLVVKRFVSIFLEPYKTSTTTIITSVGEEKFKTTATILKDLGYKVLYPSNKKDDTIPPVKKGQKVVANGYEIISKESRPPARYNDKSLLDAMEKAGKYINEENLTEEELSELKKLLKKANGIGTPATRAAIVKKMIDKKMVEKKKGKFYATELGIWMINALDNHSIASPELTGEWEGKLEKLRYGEYGYKELYKEIIEYIKSSTSELVESEKINLRGGNYTVNEDAIKDALGKCPKCGGYILENSKAYGCSNWRAGCKYVIWKNDKFLATMNKKPTEEMIKSLLKDGKVRVDGLVSKKGNEFNAILSYEKNKDNDYYGWVFVEFVK